MERYQNYRTHYYKQLSFSFPCKDVNCFLVQMYCDSIENNGTVLISAKIEKKYHYCWEKNVYIVESWYQQSRKDRFIRLYQAMSLQKFPHQGKQIHLLQVLMFYQILDFAMMMMPPQWWQGKGKGKWQEKSRGGVTWKLNPLAVLPLILLSPSFFKL